MKNKIIILGHSGFVGTHLKATLSKDDDCEVVGCSLPSVNLTSPEHVSELSSLFTPESTLVLAAAVKRQFGDTLEIFRQNMAIVENICRLLHNHPVKRIIYMSSAAVYGEEVENINISESTPVMPTSYYGIGKYAAERLLHRVNAQNKITSLVCLRPPLLYGLGDQERTYGPAGFSAAALENLPITLWGDGTELREFIYIDDLCRVISCLIKNEFSGELNVVSGVSYCFADIVNILKEKFPKLNVNSRPRSKVKANNAFNPRKIKSLLPENFQFTPLRVGLSNMFSES